MQISGRHKRLSRGTRIGDSAAARLLLAPGFVRLRHEELRIVHLDRDFGYLGSSDMRGDTTVGIPLRAVIADALQLGTRAVLLAHNHPCGDPTPSRADRVATRRLVDATRPLGIQVVDHLIFARDGSVSFRELGWL